MNTSEIIAHRLLNLQIATTKIKNPEDMVHHLVAMQAQEYAQAKWAIGLRVPGLTDDVVEQALTEGKILRTHIMRPTWHFVSPANIRWLLAATSHRVHAFNKTYYKKSELDTKVLNKCMGIITKELEGNNFRTRKSLRESLAMSKITTDTMRLSLIMMYAELEGIICSGPREGKQFTYRLLDELVPSAKVAPREELIAELTLQYFSTRGPATLHDFAWWSGLSMKEAREGAELVGKELDRFTLEGKEYLFKLRRLRDISKLQTTFLMPDYDEYGISYKDRNAIFTTKGTHPTEQAYYHMIVVEGIVSGVWKSKEGAAKVQITTTFEKSLSKASQREVDDAISKYCRFIGKERAREE